MAASDDRDLDLGMAEIDISVPHAARVYDYMLGGDTNFAVDREAAEQAAALVGGMERVRAEVRANRAFLGRAVRYMIHEAGIRQFLDIGTGLPNDDNVHAVALEEAPDAVVVYVDKDPVVLAHAHVLLLGGKDGSTVYLQEDFRSPERILERAAATLDLGQPVAVMMVGLLHHLRDGDDPAGLVARLMAGVPAGSHLAVSHLARDIHADGYVDAGEHLDDAMEEPLVFRTHDEVAAFFPGLELVDPGLVQVDTWRPAGAAGPAIEGFTNPLYVGVGRKPGG
ncbi:MAG TPA: SAM-dependent methyltransferase [Acidimicrobiales bacterium]|nr:SAM-dependent methyltransferase [Acidimicrobiales bacterium]